MWGLQKKCSCLFVTSKTAYSMRTEKSKQSLQKSEHNLQTICTSTMSAMSEQVTSNGKATTRSCVHLQQSRFHNHTQLIPASREVQSTQRQAETCTPPSTLWWQWTGFHKRGRLLTFWPRLHLSASIIMLKIHIIFSAKECFMAVNINPYKKYFIFETMPCPIGMKFCPWTVFSSSRNVFPCHSTSSGSCTQPNAFEIK